MSVSFLIPSRGRPLLLQKTIESILNKAENTLDFDFLVRLDEDDVETYKNFETWASQNLSKNKVIILTGPRHTYTGLHEYYNELANASTKNWLFIFNDDSTMETDNWDSILKPELQNFKCLNTKDHYNLQIGGSDVCFPIVPREIIKAIGFLANSPAIDSFLQGLFLKAGLVQSVNVLIHHDRFDLTGNNLDATFLEKDLSKNPGSWENGEALSAKLKEYLENKL